MQIITNCMLYEKTTTHRQNTRSAVEFTDGMVPMTSLDSTCRWQSMYMLDTELYQNTDYDQFPDLSFLFS